MTKPSDDQPPSSDPFELWRQIYDANERAWNETIERAMAQPGFAEQSGKMMETFLAGQKATREGMRTWLEAINVPTREDIARLGELIIGLEEKVDQLDDRLEGIERALSGRGAGVGTDPAEPGEPPA